MLVLRIAVRRRIFPDILYFVIPGLIAVKLFHTLRTYAMAELDIGPTLNIKLNLFPIALIIADFIAIGAYGKNALQGFDLLHGLG